MTSEINGNESCNLETDAGVKRRGLLRFGTFMTAFSGLSAISILGSSSSNAGPGDKNPPMNYVPVAEKGIASGVATLDQESKIPRAQLPDLSATYGQGISVTDPRYGAKADGITDDGPAIRAAIAAGGGGRIYFPAGTYYYKATGALILPSNTLLDGVSGATIINFDTQTVGKYTEFARNGGNDVAIQGLTINRVADFPTVMFPVQNYRSLSFRECIINGNRDIYSNYCHVFQLGVQPTGTFDGLTIQDTTVTKCSYGLFQSNSSTATARNIIVNRSNFFGNYATDLEFNAPLGENFNISVTDSTFASNQATGIGAGFGVGLAHVTGAVVHGNRFTDYNNEAVHVEDYSTGILIESNSFKRCGMIFAAYVRIISGARYTKIVNNNFDATENNNFIPVIQSVAGGAGNTPGNRKIIDPFRITIAGNHIQAGGCQGIYFAAVTGGVIANNTLQGGGSVTGGVYGGSNGGYALELWDGFGITVSGNTIRGFESALNRRTTATSTGGNGLALTGNTIQHCNYGLALVNPGAATVMGNIIQETVHPMLVGQGAGPSKPVVIVGNHANACKYAMEIGGNLVVTSNGSSTMGAAQSLAVRSLGLNLPSGKVIKFSGGGIFTLAKTAVAGATILEGSVTGAPIALGEDATVSGLSHSSAPSDNHVTMLGNADSVAGTY